MKNTLEYKGYLGSVEFDSEDELFHGRLDGIRDLVTYQATDVEGLKRSFHEAVEDYLATCQEKNKRPEKPFKGTFNVRVGVDLHRRAYLFSTEHNRKLNAVVSEALEQYLQTAR